MSSPLISVVMSVYNGEKYLDEAVQSILDQTFPDFEFIIINDGSTDSTLEMLVKYKAKDNRIVLVSRENKGLVASLNEGISLAKGKYIARMDADDISLPARFKEQYDFLEKNPEVGVCGTWCTVFGDGFKAKRWVMPTNDSDLKARLLFSVSFAHPTVMMSRTLIEKHCLSYNSNYKNAEDYRFWLDFSKHTLFSNIPKVLLRYRYHQESVSRIADQKKDEERFQIISKIQNEVLEGAKIKLTEEEIRIHFILALNERILKTSLDDVIVKSYLLKLIQHFDKEGTNCDPQAVSNFLSRKYFVYLILSFKRDKKIKHLKLFDRMFLQGGFQVLKDKLGSI